MVPLKHPWLAPLFASAALRLGLAAYFLWLQVPALYDEADHVQRARAWAAWLGDPASRDALAAALGGWRWPSLHSMLLAAGSPWAAERFVAAVLGAATTYLVYALARDLFEDGRTATLAAWGHALYPTAVFFGATLWPETPLAALAAAAALALVRSRPAVAGTVLGAAALAKIAVLPWLCLVPSWMAVRRRQGAVVVLAVAVAVAAPWYLGAALRTGSPLGRLAADDVLMGNHSCVREGAGSVVGDTSALVCLDAAADRSPNLDGAAMRTVERAVVYWGPDVFPVRHLVMGVVPAGPAMVLFVWASTWLAWAVLLGSGVAGLWARRRDAEIVLVLIVGAWLAPLVSVSQPRFHHPSLVLMMPYAAYWWSRARALRSAIPGVLAVLVAGLSAPVLMEVHLAPSWGHEDLVPSVGRLYGADVVPLDEALFLPPDPFPPDDGSGADVVLVSIDTMRADALDPRNAPFLQALADSGARFDSAWSPSSWTLPSHVSLFTGISPLHHGVVAQNQRLDDETPVLPEIARAAGYRTGAVVSAHFLSSRYGFDRGFDFYEDWGLDAPKTRSEREVRAEHLAARAMEWIASEPRDRPLFLFLHFFDAHTHYDPPLPFGVLFDPPPLRGDVRYVRYAYHAEHPPTADEMRHQRAQYHEAIRYVDHQLSRIDRALRRRARPIRWVVTADHGEEFGERGSWGHVFTLHRELTQIPLVIAGSSLTPRRVEAPVALLDVMPTVAAWFGQQVDGVDGIDLTPVLAGHEPVEPRVLVAQVARSDAKRLSWLSEPYRLEWDLPTDRRWLYDTRTSGGYAETEAVDDPALVERITKDLRERVDRAEARAPTPVPVALGHLEALGYVDP